jgi:hypothetical protein
MPESSGTRNQSDPYPLMISFCPFFNRDFSYHGVAQALTGMPEVLAISVRALRVSYYE